MLAAALVALTLTVAPQAQARPNVTSLPTGAVDTTAPRLVPLPAGFNDPNPHFTTEFHTYWWQYEDSESGVASTDSRIRSVARGSVAFSAYVYPRRWQADPGPFARPIPLYGDRSGIEYCVSTRARDVAGNVSAWSADVCTTQLSDEAGGYLNGLDASWRTTSNCTIYFWCSILRSTTKGALAIGSPDRWVSGRRFAFLVTTCTTCGQFAVYVGSTKLGVIDTHASAKHDRQLIELPLHSFVRGVVRVVVVSSGKQVLIDGFGFRLT
jgi:hypothetical protein